MFSLPIIGSISALGLAGIAGAALIAPLLRSRKALDEAIANELKFPGRGGRDEGTTLQLIFSDKALFRLVQQATVYVQNVVDEAVEDGISVAGAKVHPNVRVRFADGDFFERSGTPWVGLLVHLSIKLETTVLGQNIKLSRNMRVRLEAPAYLDDGDESSFYLNLDFRAVRVLEPDEEEEEKAAKNSTTRKIRRAIDTALRNTLSAGVLQRLDQVSVLTLSHRLLGEKSPEIHPGSIEIDGENERVIFHLKTDLDLDRSLPEAPIEGIKDKDFVVVALPEILRSLADASLAEPSMRWNWRGVATENGPLRLGIRDIRSSKDRLHFDLSLLRVHFPHARINLNVSATAGELKDLTVYEFVIKNHPALEFITRGVDNLPMLRAPLSLAMKQAFLLEPIELPQDHRLTVDISRIYANPNAIAASGQIAIREGEQPGFLQLK